MKKLIRFLMLLLLATVACSTISSCDNGNLSNPFDEREHFSKDSAMIVQFIENRTNPTFYNTNQLIMFQKQLIDKQRQDSLFKSIPIDILTDISNLCIHKYKHVSKTLVLEEYDTFMNHSTVESDVPINKTDTAKALLHIHDKSDHTKCTFVEDTIINGKHWRLVEEGVTCVQ